MQKMKKDEAWEESERKEAQSMGIEAEPCAQTSIPKPHPLCACQVGQSAKANLVEALDDNTFEAGAGEGDDVPEAMEFEGGASDDEGQEGLEMDAEKEDISGDEKAAHLAPHPPNLTGAPWWEGR